MRAFLIFSISFIVIGAGLYFGGGTKGKDFPVIWPKVDTTTGPLEELCARPGYTQSKGYPFRLDVFNSANCKAGTNTASLIANIAIAGIAAAIVVVAEAKFRQRGKA